MTRGAIMESPGRDSQGSRAESWIALGLCAAVLVAGVLKHLAKGPGYADAFAPHWLPLAAVAFAAAGVVRLGSRPLWLRVQRALRWPGVLLMMWAASGLPLDLLRLPGLIGIRLMPPGIDWPGLVTRTLALAATVVLARLALARPADAGSTRPATWYGYAAFVLALPYPVLRTFWALGWTPGLAWPGAAGRGFAPLVLAVPWLAAAALSLLLVSPSRFLPRRLLLAAGWFATAAVATIGPAACWSLVRALAAGANPRLGGIALWVFALFYGSWFFWAIAAGAATRSYQLRSAGDDSRRTPSFG
jgi:hypothetical protein